MVVGKEVIVILGIECRCKWLTYFIKSDILFQQ
jgi:hypothetical protein